MKFDDDARNNNNQKKTGEIRDQQLSPSEPSGDPLNPGLAGNPENDIKITVKSP